MRTLTFLKSFGWVFIGALLILSVYVFIKIQSREQSYTKYVYQSAYSVVRMKILNLKINSGELCVKSIAPSDCVRNYINSMGDFQTSSELPFVVTQIQLICFNTDKKEGYERLACTYGGIQQALSKFEFPRLWKDSIRAPSSQAVFDPQKLDKAIVDKFLRSLRTTLVKQFSSLNNPEIKQLNLQTIDLVDKRLIELSQY